MRRPAVLRRHGASVPRLPLSENFLRDAIDNASNRLLNLRDIRRGSP
jgi:hypothetical protein